MNFHTPPFNDPVDELGGKLKWSWLQWLQNLYNIVASLIATSGGAGLSFPYGEFSSRANQAITVADTPQRVAFDTADYANSMTFAAGDGIHVTVAGIYNVQFSLQFANPHTDAHEIIIWLRKNGTDFPYSGSKYDILAKHGSSDGYLIAVANFYVSMAAGDYVELWMACDSTQPSLEYYAAQTLPYVRPAIPSVVATVTFVSAL